MSTEVNADHSHTLIQRDKLYAALSSLTHLLTKADAWDRLPPEIAGGPDEVNAVADKCRTALSIVEENKKYPPLLKVK